MVQGWSILRCRWIDARVLCQEDGSGKLVVFVVEECNHKDKRARGLMGVGRLRHGKATDWRLHLQLKKPKCRQRGRHGLAEGVRARGH